MSEGTDVRGAASRRVEALLDGFGFGATAPPSRPGWTAVAAVLIVFALSFALFYPQVAVNVDEASYIRQARGVLEGGIAMFKVDPLSGGTVRYTISTYPLGTAFLMTPLIGAFGRQAAFVTPFLSVVAAVLITGLWLRGENRSPVFALLLLGFPATLVLSRVAMSDAPSLMVVSLGLFLFWRGLDRGTGYWLASGFVAGASILVRESNALPFLALFAGTLVRREWRAWALVVGGIAGICVRLAAASYFYDDPLFYRSISTVFGRHGLPETLALQAIGLLVFVPGGLVFALAYRGRRRAEVIASVVLFVGFYAAYRYAATELGMAKRLVLGLRFFLPLLPLLAFATAESAPRLWRAALARVSPAARSRLETATAAALLLWIAGVGTAAAGVHAVQHRWTGAQGRITQAIALHVSIGDPLVSNRAATEKFIDSFGRPFWTIERNNMNPLEGNKLVREYGTLWVALLDRTDSEFWREDARKNEYFAKALKPEPTLVFDEQVTPTDRLRIWRADR